MRSRRPPRSSGRLRSSRGPTRRRTGCGSASTPGSPSSARRATSAWTSSSPRACVLRHTASRSPSRARHATWPARCRFPARRSGRSGHHRLKDVPAAAQIFQLVAPGLREDFPPLKTLTATSLPALHHRLVGRADALARVEGLLESGVRLVTITGPGGAGKSRLALEVAARAALDRPVHLVGLAPVIDAELVPSAIARAIGARESGDRSMLESVADSLNGAGALVFLDNLEHLPTATAPVAELLDLVPDLQILATSRAPLRLSTEHVHPLAPLSIEDATTLFVELAAARGVLLQESALASVHEICRKLDGLPLAIELVAARLAVLPPAEILRALGEGLALEMEGPVDLPERQRTLRAAIDWSYGRLSPSQRALAGALAVFADSGSLDDVRTVARAGPGFLRDLEALVGWSLVRGESTDGELRLSMLRTVREYALEHANADGRLEGLQQRHADRFLELALEAEAELAGMEQAAWLNRLEGEFDNVGAALDCLLSGRVEDALRAISALERFWRAHAHVREAALAPRNVTRSRGGCPRGVRAAALSRRRSPRRRATGGASHARRGARDVWRRRSDSRRDPRTLVSQLLLADARRRRRRTTVRTRGR